MRRVDGVHGTRARGEVRLVVRDPQRHLADVDPCAPRTVRATFAGNALTSTSTGAYGVRLVGNASRERWL